MVKQKLVYRLMLLAILPVVISMVLFGSISYGIFKERLITERTEEAKSFAEHFSEDIKNPLYFLDLDDLNTRINSLKKNPHIQSVYVLGPDGRVITDGTPENKFYNQTLQDDFSKKCIYCDETFVEVDNNILHISSPEIITDRIGTVRIDFSLRELDMVLNGLIIYLSILGAIIIIGIVVAGTYISGSISKPVLKLRDATGEIARGNLNARMEIESKDEIGELASAFNTMASDLQKSVAELERAKEQIRLTSSYTRSLIETSLDPLITISKDGKITDVNKATEQVTGVSRERLIGSDFSDYFTEPEKAREGYRQVFEKGFVRDYPLAIRHSSGKVTDVLYNASVYKDEAGNVMGVFAAARDITERKLAEKIRLENERLTLSSKTKADFLSMMSHELRTPLNGIMGYSQLLKQKMSGDLNKKQEHYVDNVLISGERLLNIIEDILNLIGAEAGKMEMFIEKISVPEIIDDTVSVIKDRAAAHDIVMKKEIDNELDFIEADRLKFKQILFNLLDNAVKFSKKEGGAVTITAKKEGDMARFSVSDTGIGIKKEDVGKLFFAFEQLDSGSSRRYGGTGLGLAITKKLVELHGGTISAESRYGEGSTFTFLLPLIQKRIENNDDSIILDKTQVLYPNKLK